MRLAVLPLLLPLLFSGCAAENGDAVADVHAAAAEQSPTGDNDKPRKPANHLANESSPYLLAHAHNPVEWYPWGPEAFEAARRDNKLIFLSIGYSSCYWCHVMERLVFTNEDIARVMNEHFINIKVDREERPDVDEIYMTALQLTNQRGGWPLSMFLTPAGRPIAGGSYFPPEDQKGVPGFPSVLDQMITLWKQDRDRVRQQADLLTRLVRQALKPQLQLTPVALERGLVDGAVKAVVESRDEKFGGVDFQPQRPDDPKFPVPVKLALLQYAQQHGENGAADEVLKTTLDHMARGGIYDHVGGGFHRYSTDRQWLVPHFEKMLYDQAQLVDVYAEAFRRTGDAGYRNVVKTTVEFVLREMTDERGGFYSALDAETGAVEGKYYVWTADEIDAALGGTAELFKTAYGLHLPQMFEAGYVLHLPVPLDELAAKQQIPLPQLRETLERQRGVLLKLREQRERPLLDDKILVSWNGLMIRGLARAGAALDEPAYIAAAARAADFILDHMRGDDGRLYRTHRGGKSKLNAYLDDYAFFVEGLLALHAAANDEKWLTAARELTDLQIKLMWDEAGHGFFFTTSDHEELVAQIKNAGDTVMPSGNSTSARNLLRLARITGEDQYRRYARETLEVFAPAMESSPTGLANMVMALAEFLAPSNEPQREQGGVRRDQKLDADIRLSTEKLPAGGTCRVAIRLNIDDGWHINTNPARPDYLEPTTITLRSQHGTQLTDLKFPAGETLSIPGMPQPLHVYSGRLTVEGTLRVPASAAGKTEAMELQIRYRACSETTCLRPLSLNVPITIAVASDGEVVRDVSAELFPPEH